MKTAKRGRVFIIAEAGSNWKAGSVAQDRKRAAALIEAARAAGADAVKFQLFRAETVYVPNAGSSDYLSKSGIRESIIDIFNQMALPYAMVPWLASRCRKAGIRFMCSAFSPEDFRKINPYVSVHKIASYEISHPHLLKLAAQSRKPLILSTGAATIEDIDWAVSFFKKNGGRNLTLMQCTAKYPAPFSALHLNVIPELARRYGVETGFSDHSRDPITAPVAAVALGASVIEKHFTLSNSLKGPDHAFAVTPAELQAMVSAIRACEVALGNKLKAVDRAEDELRHYAQRSLQVSRAIKKGERITESSLSILRPGKQKKGLHPRYLSSVVGRIARRALPIGRGIVKEDVR